MKKSSFAKADFSRSSKSERNLIKTPLLCMRNKINSQKSFSNKEKQEKKRFSSCFLFFRAAGRALRHSVFFSEGRYSR